MNLKSYSTRLIFALSVLSFSIFFFGGCVTSSSVGDKMMQQGKVAKDLGKKWNKGERMVKKGERMLASAKRLAKESDRDASKSEKLISEGEKLVAEGQGLMAENQQAFNEKFPE